MEKLPIKPTIYQKIEIIQKLPFEQTAVISKKSSLLHRATIKGDPHEKRPINNKKIIVSSNALNRHKIEFENKTIFFNSKRA